MGKRPKTPSRTRFAKKAADFANRIKQNPALLLSDTIQKKASKTRQEKTFYMDIGNYVGVWYETFILISKNPSESERFLIINNNSEDSIDHFSIKRYTIRGLDQKVEIQDVISSLVNPKQDYSDGTIKNLGESVLYQLKIGRYDPPFQMVYNKLKNMALEYQ